MWKTFYFGTSAAKSQKPKPHQGEKKKKKERNQLLHYTEGTSHYFYFHLLWNILICHCKQKSRITILIERQRERNVSSIGTSLEQGTLTNYSGLVFLFIFPRIGESCLINPPLLYQQQATVTTHCAKLFNWACFVVNSSDHSSLNDIMYVLTASSDTNLSRGDTNLSVVGAISYISDSQHQ